MVQNQISVILVDLPSICTMPSIPVGNPVQLDIFLPICPLDVSLANSHVHNVLIKLLNAWDAGNKQVAMFPIIALWEKCIVIIYIDFSVWRAVHLKPFLTNKIVLPVQVHANNVYLQLYAWLAKNKSIFWWTNVSPLALKAISKMTSLCCVENVSIHAKPV